MWKFLRSVVIPWGPSFKQAWFNTAAFILGLFVIFFTATPPAYVIFLHYGWIWGLLTFVEGTVVFGALRWATFRFIGGKDGYIPRGLLGIVSFPVIVIPLTISISISSLLTRLL